MYFRWCFSPEEKYAYCYDPSIIGSGCFACSEEEEIQEDFFFTNNWTDVDWNKTQVIVTGGWSRIQMFVLIFLTARQTIVWSSMYFQGEKLEGEKHEHDCLSLSSQTSCRSYSTLIIDFEDKVKRISPSSLLFALYMFLSHERMNYKLYQWSNPWWYLFRQNSRFCSSKHTKGNNKIVSMTRDDNR